MPRFAANLSMMYQQHPFLQRFEAAAQDGFDGVEFLFPYDYPAAQLKQALDAHGLAQVLFNAPPGNWAEGERGLASLPGREAEFRRSIGTALAYADVLGNRLIHVMAGLLQPALDPARQRALYLENLGYAATQAAAHGITILIEPINTRNMPGYPLNLQDDAQAICAEIGMENLQVQFDCYHCQIMEGDVAVKLRRDIRGGAVAGKGGGGVGHIQIAGVPDRHEPDQGELHYPYLLDLIDTLGYKGWIGCEYIPAGDTSEGLAWLRTYRHQSGRHLHLPASER